MQCLVDALVLPFVIRVVCEASQATMLLLGVKVSGASSCATTLQWLPAPSWCVPAVKV